jgi:hypothetical protein
LKPFRMTFSSSSRMETTVWAQNRVKMETMTESSLSVTKVGLSPVNRTIKTVIRRTAILI